MASNGLRDQNRLEGASNYVIWKSRIEFLLDEHDLKALIDNAVAEPLDAAHLRQFKKNMARAKRLILGGVKDHIAPHIATKNTAREMWVGLEKLYQGSFEQRKMYLEEKMCVRLGGNSAKLNMN